MRLFGLPAAGRLVRSAVAGRRFHSYPSLLISAAAACGLLTAVAVLPADAATITVGGTAVGSYSGTAQEGITENRPIGNNAIKYFIPLGGNDRTYGAGSSCGGNGSGTCADFGNGGPTLTMFLHFVFPETVEATSLTIAFEDLDLRGVRDPVGHREELRVRVGQGPGAIDTGWIDNITDTGMAGDSDLQTLTLLLSGLPESNEFYVRLRFRADSFFGTNTPEYLLATLSGVTAVPLPAAVWLFGSALAGLGGLSRLRRWRAARAAAV